MAQTFTKWIELLVPFRFLLDKTQRFVFQSMILKLASYAYWAGCNVRYYLARYETFCNLPPATRSLDQFLEDFRFERLGRNGIHGCMGHHGHYIPSPCLSCCTLFPSSSVHHPQRTSSTHPYHNLQRLVGNPGQVLKLFEHIFVWAIRCVGWMPIIPLDWNCSASESIAIISS